MNETYHCSADTLMCYLFINNPTQSTQHIVCFFFPVRVVQVCRPLGHPADHFWDHNGHNQWDDESTGMYCVWTLDRQFYSGRQDVPQPKQFQ